MKSQATKTVTILVRYFIKSSQSIICKVRNGENREYFVTLHKNGDTCCTCKHGESAGRHAHCLHVKAVQAVESSKSAKVEAALAEAWQLVEANWQEAEVESERADYLALTHQTTSDTINHLEQDATLAAVMEQAQSEMVQFDRDVDPNAYDILAETKLSRADAETRRCYIEMSLGF